MSQHSGFDFRRRHLLQLGASSAAGWLVGCRARESGDPQPAASARVDAPRADVSMVMRTGTGEVPLFEGAATRVWRITADLASGPSDTVVPMPAGSYLGPMLNVRRGNRMSIELANGLPEATILHWHGLDVPELSDGHPRFAVDPGQRYRYAFRVQNRAGTYWYHPHPHGRTGAQVIRGMAGVLIVRDDEEDALPLPPRDQEIVLAIQDRVFDDGNQIVYRPQPHSGFLGDRIVVNGTLPTPTVVRRGSYRLRVLNGSNARIYKLAWSDGRPIVAIGSDGGLLPAPLRRPYLMLAPGERVEVWVDFSDLGDGDRLALRSLAFRGGGMMGMMGGGMMGGRPMGGGMMSGGMMGGRPMKSDNGARTGSGSQQGAAFEIQTFVVKGIGQRLDLPTRLAEVAAPPSPERDAIAVVTQFRHMAWTLSGRTFESEQVAPEERIPLGAVQDWQISNPGHMMAVPHPIHFHGPSFQILERQIASRQSADYATVKQGFVDSGWKDTVLVMPGERVRVRMRYATHSGLFLYHCHNLEHEDMGMMRNFRVDGPSRTG